MRNKIIRELLIIVGCLVLMFLGYVIYEPSVCDDPRQILTLILFCIGLFGYPAYLIIKFIARAIKAFKEVDPWEAFRQLGLIALTAAIVYAIIWLHFYSRRVVDGRDPGAAFLEERQAK